MDKRDTGRLIKSLQLDCNTLPDDFLSYPIWLYLIVKGSVGPFFDRSVFLLISKLNNHAGVDVISYQLPGFCDVDGNLWVRHMWDAHS